MTSRTPRRDLDGDERQIHVRRTESPPRGPGPPAQPKPVKIAVSPELDPPDLLSDVELKAAIEEWAELASRVDRIDLTVASLTDYLQGASAGERALMSSLLADAAAARDEMADRLTAANERLDLDADLRGVDAVEHFDVRDLPESMRQRAAGAIAQHETVWPETSMSIANPTAQTHHRRVVDLETVPDPASLRRDVTLAPQRAAPPSPPPRPARQIDPPRIGR